MKRLIVLFVGMGMLFVRLGSSEAQTVWWESGMVKLRQANSGTAGDPIPSSADLCTSSGCSKGGVVLSSGRNEFEPFQILVAAPSGSGLTGVDVTVSDLKDNQGNVIAARDTGGKPKNIVIYREHYLVIDGTKLSSSEAKPGLWPDGLVPKVDEYFGEVRRMPGEGTPAFPFNVAADKKQGVWVDVYVPQNTPAGIYTGSAQVILSGIVKAQIPIKLTVRAFDLPSTPTLKTAYAVGAGEVAMGHYGTQAITDAKYWELICLYTKEMLLHRVSNESVIWPRLVWDSNQGKINWSLPAISTTCNQRYPEFLTGGNPTLLPNGKLPGAKVTRARMKDGTTSSSTAIQSVAYYRDYIQHFTSLGWKDRLFYYLWDEPPYPDATGVRRCDQNFLGVPSSAWRNLYNKSKFFKDNGLDIPMMITTSRQATEDCFTNYLKIPNYTRYIDIWTVPNRQLHGRPTEGFPFNTNLRSSYDAIVTTGKELWWYHACGNHGCGSSDTGFISPMVDLPAAYNRAFQWQTYNYQIGYRVPGPTTELYYETVYAYQFSANDPWKNLFYFGGNGDGTFFYPGTPAKIGGTKHIPIASIRMKLLREGIEDYEYLTLVEAKKNREGINGKEWVKNNILNPYLSAQDPKDGVKKFVTYVWNKDPGSATSPAGLLRAREEMAKVLAGQPTFTLSASPVSATVLAGNGAVATVSVTSQDGFNAAVALSCTTSHSSVGCTLNPNSVIPPFNGQAFTTLSMTTQGASPVGSYTVTVRGNSGSSVSQTTFTLVVSTPPDFRLTPSPLSATVVAGNSVTSSVAVSSLNQFSSIVGLTCSTSHPTVTCTLSPSGVIPPINGNATSTLSVSTQTGTPAGAHSVTLSGASAGLIRKGVFALTVTAGAPPSFTELFDRVDSTNLGPNWNEYLLDFGISGNQMTNLDIGSQEAQWIPSLGVNQDVSVDCKVAATGNSCGVMTRWSNADNFYYVLIDPGAGNITLLKKVNGVYSTLGKANRTMAYNTFYRVRVVAAGNALTVYYAGEATPAIVQVDSSLPTGSYAGIRSFAATAGATRFDRFNGIPLKSLISDSFDRANNPSLGGTWNEYRSHFEINGNQVRNSNTADHEAQWTQSIGPNQDVSVDCKVVTIGNSCGVMARWSNADTFYYARIDPGAGNIALLRKTNGVYSTLALASRTMAYNTFYRMRLVVIGNTINVYYAGETAPLITMTDLWIPTGNYAGIRSYGASIAATSLDNFMAVAP